MLLNLSISSLFVSSLSNSPFFSSNNKYLINSCKFYRFFPIIFYQTQNLKVQDSHFTSTLSNVIFIDNKNYSDYNINDIPRVINDPDNVIFQRSEFVINADFNINTSSSVLIIECLFYDMKAYNTFMQISAGELIISGCCFSKVSSSKSIFESSSSSSTPKAQFNYNIAIEVKSEYFLLGQSISFSCTYSNLTSNKISNSMFSWVNADASFSYSQMTKNELTTIITILVQPGSLKIDSLYFMENTILSSQTSLSYPIFNVGCPNIAIDNTVFADFKKTGNGNIILFATPVYTPSNIHVLITNNMFDSDIYRGNYYYYPQPNVGDYTNNSEILYTIPTNVVSMNPYLYQYYRAQCRIYLFPTQIFTQSDPFTKSDIFTPSDFFITASPSISPTSSCSPSMSPSPSTSPTPSPSLSPSVNAAYGIVGAVGTAVVSFGLSSLVWLSIRKCCIYDHDNYLHMDV